MKKLVYITRPNLIKEIVVNLDKAKDYELENILYDLINKDTFVVI